MRTIPAKEEMFNRFYNGEMDKKELARLMKQLLLDQELREWFISQMEFMSILNDPQLCVKN